VIFLTGDVCFLWLNRVWPLIRVPSEKNRKRHQKIFTNEQFKQIFQKMNHYDIHLFASKFCTIVAVFITLQLCTLMTSGCLSSGGNKSKQAKNYRSGRNYFSSSSSSSPSHDSSRNTIKRRYLTLNNGAAFQSTTHIHTEEGEPIYGRIIVPFSFGDSNTLTITAFWDENFETSPLWMFLKAGSSLPTTKTYDKQSISFTSRKYARIRKDFVEPGEYTLLFSPLKDIEALTINISILPVTHKGAGNSYWRPSPIKKDSYQSSIPWYWTLTQEAFKYN